MPLYAAIAAWQAIAMGGFFRSCVFLRHALCAAQGLTNVSFGPWKQAGDTRQRVLKYTKPLSIPVPFAPKSADVTEVHTVSVYCAATRSGWRCSARPAPGAPRSCRTCRIVQLHAKEASGFVMEVVVTTDAPKGDTFRVVTQVHTRAASPGCLALRVMRVNARAWCLGCTARLVLPKAARVQGRGRVAAELS